MGEYGCPFAATDFLSVDPAMAEFDEFTTPLDQFRELIDAVHARHGLLLVDLPANHTGWASTLQTHHPDWFRREADGRFHSPGAWGVKWADLVELDFGNAALRAYMADVFLFWCRNGVDGFRCDAGYMIPLKTWEYIVARVREEYPDTIFMLEGLGGDLKLTDDLLAVANLDWAYSEIFQTYDRGAFEWYLPGAIVRSEKFGTLVHFAETHDNDRLAKKGETYARLRVQLAALLSWQGAWGIANGVEWFCTEKIDVHGKNDLAWGAESNMVDLIAKLNHILGSEPSFSGESHLSVVTRGEGNTLAVVRSGATDGEGVSRTPSAERLVLVLANLDCGAPAMIDWDREAFPHGEAFDLLSQRKVKTSGPVPLKPGEVLCLASMSAKQPANSTARQPSSPPTSQSINFHWVYPRDLKRVVCVPENEWVEVSAATHFRVRLVDPETGKTLRVYRSRPDGDRHVAMFDAPHYKGDGTHCRRLEIAMIVYADGKATRTRADFLIPPPGNVAAAKLSMTGDEVRRHPEYRTVLSNGAGAASQVRIGWGSVASQYDAMLAANTNPNVPSDRLNLWTRTRCWLQREGYTRELDAKCVTSFTADPAGRGARWDFLVPCGMGRSASFAFVLSLADGRNAARLLVTRYERGESDVGDQVRLVFRPDIEWRSFHATTKAYAGLEELFPKKTAAASDGFVFAPYDGEFRMAVANGVYHHEPQWDYSVPHPEEAARGQDGSGDLFSPGWISADLKCGESVEIVGALGDAAKGAHWGAEQFSAVASAPVPDVLRNSIDLFIVKRDDLKTVIAGYPWFLDWGRDTFIFMRGMIAAGKIADSVRILKAFAAFEENGTLPNIIYGNTAGNRDTTDAQLWFVRCVQELDGKIGGNSAALKATCESIVDNYIKGTPNGIKMDPESALVWSPSHFTWMDTNYPACTPREGYPVEIQALWISALRFLGRDELAERALASVRRYFRREDGRGYFDCLAAAKGVGAADATPEDTVRPNQLFLITLGILDDRS
ncbi:MAG: glycogen debranching enzyme N-terminal domain-containing protein, partial [Kiritimatiellae bacterium]|nr:glycogen debranching enzyme N-terminal domain-containing protein [Kiritimatiellia bacterium]